MPWCHLWIKIYSRAGEALSGVCSKVKKFKIVELRASSAVDCKNYAEAEHVGMIFDENMPPKRIANAKKITSCSSIYSLERHLRILFDTRQHCPSLLSARTASEDPFNQKMMTISWGRFTAQDSRLVDIFDDSGEEHLRNRKVFHFYSLQYDWLLP